MKNLLYVLLLSLLACGEPTTSVTGDANLEGFEIIKLENTDGEMAIKRNADGDIIEQGIIRKGVKDGLWVTYHDDDNKLPSRITSYSNGIKNGPDMTLSNRGQIEEMSQFMNNKLEGKYGKFRFGRPTVSTDYSNGQFNGQHKEYGNNGKLQKLIEFKDGKQHGLLQYFDDQGNITLEYTYENGEKVSGGIVE